MLPFLLLLAVVAASAQASQCWKGQTCAHTDVPAFKGPWEKNHYAPESRIVRPKRFFPLTEVEDVSDFEDVHKVLLDQTTNAVVFDFGIEVGGLPTIEYKANGPSAFGLAFTEAKDFIGKDSDSSHGRQGLIDGAVYAEVTDRGKGSYTVPDKQHRGGFRYLTVFLESYDTETKLDIQDVSLELSFQPTWANLRAYQGYFHSDNDLLNRIWYAGAWTVQSNSIPGDTGIVDPVEDGWFQNGTLTEAATVLVDGAKRDRLVWNGDMGTAVPSAFVSTGDLASVKNALLVIYESQNSEGVFPKAGPPNARYTSDTYHIWHLFGTFNYLTYSGDVKLIEEIWPKLYRVLENTASIFSWIPELSSGDFNEAVVRDKASKLKDAIFKQLWDCHTGAFRDSPGSQLHPQDANSMALAYGLVEGRQAQRVSDFLASRWTPIGPECPELPKNVAAFVSSIELHGHFEAGRADRAVELINSLWGWYLEHENGTQPTTPEGYNVDGSWLYRKQRDYAKGEPYVSHSHSWSSGPTSTLTEYMVGLRITKLAGKEWSLKPAKQDTLKSLEAGFTTQLGRFSASLRSKGKKAILEWDTPVGTIGTLDIPGHKSKMVKGGKGKAQFDI